MREKREAAGGRKKRALAMFLALLLCIGAIGFAPGNMYAAAESENHQQIKLPVNTYTADGEGILPEISTHSGEILEHIPDSKKGIQEAEYFMDTDYRALGIRHVTLNFVINGCIAYRDGNFVFTDDGQIAHLQNVVRQMNADGVTVSMILLLRWWEDSSLQKLILPSARTAGQPFFYALNCEEAEARQVWADFFAYLCSQFAQGDCHVDNWILGNEVNQCDSSPYNYTGSKDLSYNTAVYANALKTLNEGIKRSGNPSARSYISLDHNWTASDTGHSGKDFLTGFAQNMGNEPWSVAWHAYAPALDAGNPNVPYEMKVIWNSPYVTHDSSTPYICGSNIDVLTEFLRQNYGEQHRVILSEQGYDASGGEELQAAFVAYTYYAAQYNDMVDAVMYRAYIDNLEEVELFGVRLGFLGGSQAEMKAWTDQGRGQEYIDTYKRKAYDVFKYMDTEWGDAYTAECLKTIGAAQWSQLVAGYPDRSEERWQRVREHLLELHGSVKGLLGL